MTAVGSWASKHRPHLRHRYAASPWWVETMAALYLGHFAPNFDPRIDQARLIYAFEAVIIGGLGSLWGTLAGGVIIGVAQTHWKARSILSGKSSPGHLGFFAGPDGSAARAVSVGCGLRAVCSCLRLRPVGLSRKGEAAPHVSSPITNVGREAAIEAVNLPSAGEAALVQRTEGVRMRTIRRPMGSI